MTKTVDARERQREVLGLVIDSYIEESKPISSAYLCKKYNLNYSSATIRNILQSLENQGLLSHIHTSSGRVPTQEGFKSYIKGLKEKENAVDNVNLELRFQPARVYDAKGLIDYVLDTLTKFSGYTSLLAVSDSDEKIFFRGVRFMLDQPEFKDVSRLKDIFYALEVKMDIFQTLLFDCIDEDLRIFIGDDIGFDEISECSLMVSGLKERNASFALALLGPMRMDYSRASLCLKSVRSHLKELVGEL